MVANHRRAVNSIYRSRSRGSFLVILGISIFLMIALIAAWTFRATENSKARINEDEDAALFSLKAKIIEFTALNKRLPTITEYQDVLSNGFADRLGRIPIYLVADNLDSTGDICQETLSPITLHHCGPDAACATPRITTQLPFILLAGGNVVTTSSIVSQTTTATQNAVISSPIILTTFSLGTVVGSFSNRAQDVSNYDDMVLTGTFSELWNSAQCKSANQGDIGTKGVSVRILNTPGALPDATVGLPYTAPIPPFKAYGSDLSTYTWSSTLTAGGLSLVPLGNTAQITGTPTAGGGPYNLTVSVTATIPGVNTATHSVAMTLRVCPYANSTGNTRTQSCGAGYTGAINEYQVETCTGTFSWIESGRTCAAIPLPSETLALNAANLGAAGADTSGRNLNVASLTVNGTTITAGETGGAIRHLSQNSSNTGIGVVNVGATSGYAIFGTDTLEFYFGGGLGTTASVVFSRLGRTTSSPITYDSATITFYAGATVVGTLTKTACSVLDDQNATLVAFNDLSPGAPFDTVKIQAAGASSFYVANVKACAGVTCSTSTIPTATCP